PPPAYRRGEAAFPLLKPEGRARPAWASRRMRNGSSCDGSWEIKAFANTYQSRACPGNPASLPGPPERVYSFQAIDSGVEIGRPSGARMCFSQGVGSV